MLHAEVVPEIERLRAALTKIVQAHSGLDSYDDLRRYARNALEGLSDETRAPQPLPCECTTYCAHAGYPDSPLRRGYFCRQQSARRPVVKHDPRCEWMQPHGHEPPKCTCSAQETK